MVAYTDSLGFYKNSAGFTANYTDRVSVIEIELDFAKIAAARTAASAAALAATDTLVIGVLPKGSFVLSGVATLEKAEGAAGNIDVGIGGGNRRLDRGAGHGWAARHRIERAHGRAQPLYAAEAAARPALHRPHPSLGARPAPLRRQDHIGQDAFGP